MRASDTERDRVAERLREAVAEGRLETDEFEHRLDAALKARTHGELAPLVRDLPSPGSTMEPAGAASPVPAGRDGTWVERIGGPATSRRAFAFWGGFNRGGRWTVGREFTAFAMWGGGHLDLREARFEEREVLVRCFAVMGGIGVTVEPDVHLEVDGVGVMGGFGEYSPMSEEAEPVPGAPRVRIVGFALLGGVDVQRKWSKAGRRKLTGGS
ncbi:DUF1707 SHOCT-like domain-containing protein [Streptomyces fulvorobeus]|uniref:DUF1707 domain-containing protein n=1 Tax=Streptomyces fulvorobeus TaxID=284028 RepID=A0A7J0C616_9ACTN|nr:DUF1707 domain-containing protein [Streptomyces fulvorobeus]NYE41043.1 hypothetical protein [Streptomyces fulvorobeus]GFM97373.1 hypothetical protein Sfulv_21840 [Streptomyces fulvorobeus]